MNTPISAESLLEQNNKALISNYINNLKRGDLVYHCGCWLDLFEYEVILVNAEARKITVIDNSLSHKPTIIVGYIDFYIADEDGIIRKSILGKSVQLLA